MRSFRSKTGCRGVDLLPSGRYRAKITLFNKVIQLGTFDTVEEAEEIWDAHYEKFENRQSEFHSQIYSKTMRNRRGTQNNRAGYFGVEYVVETDHYRAYSRNKRKYESLGTYETAIEAALAVNRYLDKIDDDGPRNDIIIKDIIELKRKRAKEQEQRNKYSKEKDMKRLKIHHYKDGVEAKIQRDIIRYLSDRGWFVRVLHGNTFQAGLSDLIACHKKYGIRLIEVKNPVKHRFTAAQLSEFPKFISNGAPIYVLTGANEENYKRLFGSSNLWIYMSGISDGK